MEEFEPLEIPLSIDSSPAPSFKAFIAARDRGYARLAQLHGMSETPPSLLDVSPTEAASPTPTDVIVPSDRKAATDAPFPSQLSAGPKPWTRFSPSSHAALPLTEGQGVTTLHEACNGEYLIMHACSGSPQYWKDLGRTVAHERPWMRLMVDSGSWALWTFWDNYELIDPEPSTQKQKHTHDFYQSERRSFDPEVWHTDAFTTPNTVYRYVPVSAPFSIFCGESKDPDPRTIDLSILDYRLAIAVSPRLGEYVDVDGIVGMRAQAYRPLDSRQHHSATQESSRRTLITQLQDQGMLSRTAKTFVISPAHRALEGITPRLWIGVWSWPRSIEQSLVDAYGFDRESKEVILPTITQIRGKRPEDWAVYLQGIIARNRHTGEDYVLFEAEDRGVYASLDTGTELAFLPDQFFNHLEQSPLRATRHDAFTPDGTAVDFYTFNKSNVSDDWWLELRFRMDNGEVKHIYVAPLAKAMSYRDSQYARYEGEHNIAACPMAWTKASDGVLTIGLNWLKYLWVSYRDRPDAVPEIALVPGHKK